MNLLGLQVLAEEVPELMCEFILEDNGTVMLDARDGKSWVPYLVTGYVLRGPGIIEFQGSECHAKTVRGTHQVFTNEDIGKEEPLMDVLRAEDIVH